MGHSNHLNAFQSAWVVDDIHEAANLWAEKAGIGPFFVADYQEGAIEGFYRGKPAPITMKTALAQAGSMQIELIQPTGDGPSAYRDTVPMGRPGLHHIALWSNDLNADIALYVKKGFEVAARGGTSGIAEFAYIDTSAVFGHMIELVEGSDIIRSVFSTVADAAIEWDGTDPVRSYPGS
jgi:catechol 2,3-dioxygenase-like lactoylglutathione lyase family enzyme